MFPLLSTRFFIISYFICSIVLNSTFFNKRDLLENLLSKPLSMDEKVRRILALEAEEKNAEICDYTVKVSGFDAAAKEILDGLFGKKKKR